MKKILIAMIVMIVSVSTIITLSPKGELHDVFDANVEALAQDEIPYYNIGFDVKQCNEREPIPGNFNNFCRKFNNICNRRKTGTCDPSNNCEHAPKF